MLIWLRIILFDVGHNTTHLKESYMFPILVKYPTITMSRYYVDLNDLKIIKTMFGSCACNSHIGTSHEYLDFGAQALLSQII